MTYYNIGITGIEVGDFTLTFIAPLCAYNN